MKLKKGIRDMLLTIGIGLFVGAVILTMAMLWAVQE